MAITPVIIEGGITLGITLATIYTATGNAKVTAPAFVNTTASPVTLTISITRSGGAAKTITPGVPVAANTVYLAPELSGLVLANGDIIQAQASAAASINAFISGIGGF